jgi:hypothetical protein
VNNWCQDNGWTFYYRNINCPIVRMEQLFIKQKFNECEICAFHESGHILFAYLCGYTCRYVELIDEHNEEGFASVAVIDYGKDAYMVSKLTDLQHDTDYFSTLALGEKLECIEIGHRLARIFLGGSAAAAVFNNNGSAHIELPMQMDYTDLLRTEFIDSIIREISIAPEEDFIENILQDALYTLTNQNVWATIDDLAKRLLASRQLNKNDIEECLEEHGIFFDKTFDTIP